MKLSARFESHNLGVTKNYIGGKKKMKTLEVLEKILKGKRLAPHTQRLYTDVFKSLAKYSPEYPTSHVVINEWIAQITGYADTTIKMMFRFGKSGAKFLTDLYPENDAEYIPNPFLRATMPKVEKKQRRIFSAEQMLGILETCRLGYDRELILTLIDSTCRISNLEGLQGKDVDVEGECINTHGKTGFERYRLDRRICIALKNLAGSDDGYVFKSRGVKPASANALAWRVRRIVKRAGITGEKLGPHTLRHTDASMVAEITGSALAVKALLRHSDIRTSMVYIHEVEEKMQQKVSPLQLIADRTKNGNPIEVKIEPRQISMGEGEGMVTDLVIAEPEIIDGKTDYEADLFPEVVDGIKVRPLLKTDDLRLMRQIFLDYSRMGGNHQRMMQARELMKRMLRRT